MLFGTALSAALGWGQLGGCFWSRWLWCTRGHRDRGGIRGGRGTRAGWGGRGSGRGVRGGWGLRDVDLAGRGIGWGGRSHGGGGLAAPAATAGARGLALGVRDLAVGHLGGVRVGAVGRGRDQGRTRGEGRGRG